MAETEWWQRGPIDGVPAVLQPVAHMRLQVRDSGRQFVEPVTGAEWNARPAGVASAAFHVRHVEGVIAALTYARGDALTPEQYLRSRRSGGARPRPRGVLAALDARVSAAVAELRTIDCRNAGRLSWGRPGTVDVDGHGCLVHGAEHAMRHVGQLR